MAFETCANCGAHFPATEAWENRGGMLAFLYPAIADLSTRVRCPSCGHVFPATEIRYLGVLSPRGMKILVLALVGGIALGAVYLLFIDPLFSR
jgi:DNA-directed RNA polymerase subunit RPC12/RpoP